MRDPNPNNQRTGTPETLAMRVNAVNDSGTETNSIARDRWGRLLGLDKYGFLFTIDEGEFHAWLEKKRTGDN